MSDIKNVPDIDGQSFLELEVQSVKGQKYFELKTVNKESIWVNLPQLKVFTVGFLCITFRWFEVHYSIIPTAAIEVVCP